MKRDKWGRPISENWIKYNNPVAEAKYTLEKVPGGYRYNTRVGGLSQGSGIEKTKEKAKEKAIDIIDYVLKELKKELEIERGERFDPDSVRKGDLVDFGIYGNLYIVYPTGDRFWVTDTKEKLKKEYPSGWFIRQNYANKIIRKGR